MSCCDSGPRGILFSILNSGSPRAQGRAQGRAQTLCSCASNTTTVSFRSPHLVFQVASDVLVKSFTFVKHVPCFRSLPAEDQLRLVRSSWAPLLVLGLVQDSVHFDTVETQRSSLLHGILTQHGGEVQRDPGVPAGDVEGVKMVLDVCGSMRISVKEYAFLKGAILFTPEATELECRDYIHALQREAERALYEHVRTVYRDKPSRFEELRLVLVTLRSLEPNTVAGLFFRPVTGTVSVDEHVFAMFFKR